MMEGAKAAYRAMLAIDDETPRLVRFVLRALAGRESPRVFDVGCGYGRTLRALRDAGVQATGIDVNLEIVERNNIDGLECLLPEDFRARGLAADVLVMSHVVEHFAPRDLLAFIDGYLEFLRPGGFLVLATPLLTDRFFDDFDHVKPYQPTGLGMVFGGRQSQVQYYGRSTLALEDIWFRRSAFSITFAKGMYVRNWTTPVWRIVNLGYALLFRSSGGLIGRTTGWVGLYRKV